MENTNQLEIARKMDKQGMRIFSLLALFVYLSALTYCYFTTHFFEMGVVGGVMILLAILIFRMYYSTDKH